MLLRIIFWGGRVMAVTAMIACIVVGFLSEPVTSPFWWFVGYIALFNILNLTSLGMSVFSHKATSDIKELAKNLITDRIKNSNIDENVNFMLRPQYKKGDLARVIDEWLPDAEKGNYSIYTQPFCLSILTILFGKGTRPAFLVYKPYFYNIKTMIDDAITVMAICLLAFASLHSLPWDFWTGSGYEYGLMVGAGIAGVVVAIKHVWLWLTKTEYITDWHGVLSGILGVTVFPALDVVTLGWIMPVFIAASMIQIGFEPIIAAAVGIGITVPYYVFTTLGRGWRQGIYAIFMQVIRSTMMFIWGFPAVMLFVFITHLAIFISSWLGVRKRRRESPTNLYK